MQRFFITSVFFFFLSSKLLAAFWQTDWQSAVEKSQKENKPLLLFFSGSDWSGLSMKMKNEILDTKDFQEKVQDALICLEIDFPKHASQRLEQEEQNQKLKERFAVEEFPALVLIDEKQREITRQGFVCKTGLQFADVLLQIIKQDRELSAGLSQLSKDANELRALYQLAGELGRKDAENLILTAGVHIQDPFFLMERYRLVYETKTNEAKTLKEKLLSFNSYQTDFTLALLEYQRLAKEAADPHVVVKPLEEYLARHRDEDHENIWRIEMMIAETFLDSDEWQNALSHANKAIEYSPQDMKEKIKHLIDYICDQQIAEK